MSFFPLTSKPIITFAKDSQDKVFIVSENGVIKKCFDTVWGKYKNSTGEELSEMTHRKGTAWDKANSNRQHYLADEDIEKDGTELA